MTTHFPLLLAQVRIENSKNDADPPPNMPRMGSGGQDTIEGQPAGTSAVERNTPQREPAAGPNIFWMLILGVMMVWIFSMFSGQRREKKKRAALLATLAKGKKVQTVGGILATVVEVRDNDVLLKVDENSNTRIKFSRSAIQSVTEETEE